MLTLFIAVVGAALILANNEFVSYPKTRRRINVWLFACTVAAASVTWWQSRQESRINATTGTLSPQAIAFDAGVEIVTGTNSSRFVWAGSPPHLALNGIPPNLPDVPITLTVLPQGLSVSAKVWNWDGTLAGELRDNEWSVSPGSYYDRNYDQNSLEIVDKRDIPLLQVRLINPNKVRIGGVFFGSDGISVVGDSGAYVGVEPRTLDNVRAVVAEMSLRRWFRYPSKTHLGEMESSDPQ